VVATGSAECGHHRLIVSTQRPHPSAGERLGQADGFAAGLADVRVVQQPVDGGAGTLRSTSRVESEGVGCADWYRFPRQVIAVAVRWYLR
jgi:hypothetical protein